MLRKILATTAWITTILVASLGAYLILYEPTWTPANQRKVEVEQVHKDCSVIGDMADYSTSMGHFTRTIFQCPDGMIKIR